MYSTFTNVLLVALATILHSHAYPDGAIIFPGPLNYHHVHHHPYHHHHHHMHDYDDEDEKSKNSDAPPESSARSGDESSKDDGVRNAFENITANEIPLDFIAKLNNESYTVNDLLLHYVEDYDDDTIIRNRFGDDDENNFEERNNVGPLIDAKCMPELQTVELLKSDDPLVVYFPACTRIERCGGCCKHKLLSCQPTEIEMLNFKVIKTQYTIGNKLKFVGKELVEKEKHIKCECKCRVRKEDCTPQQVYNENSCKCMCRNIDEENKCQRNNTTKLWNSETCSCQCREEKLCSTGTYFDLNTCKCALNSIKRRYAEYPRRSGYDLSVIPLH